MQGYPKAGNDMCYKQFENVLLNPKEKHLVLNKGFRYVEGYMKSYEQVKKRIIICIPQKDSAS
jgi:hypothetical protein